MGLIQQLFRNLLACALRVDGRYLGNGVHVPLEGVPALDMCEVKRPVPLRKLDRIVHQNLVAEKMARDCHDGIGILDGMVERSPGLGMGQHHDRDDGMLRQDVQMRAQAVGPSPGRTMEVSVRTYQVRSLVQHEVEEIFNRLEFVPRNVPPSQVPSIPQDLKERSDFIAERLDVRPKSIRHDQNFPEIDRGMLEDSLGGGLEHAFELVDVGHGKVVSNQSSVVRGFDDCGLLYSDFFQVVILRPKFLDRTILPVVLSVAKNVGEFDVAVAQALHFQDTLFVEPDLGGHNQATPAPSLFVQVEFHPAKRVAPRWY